MLMLDTDLARFDALTLQILIDSLPLSWQSRITRKKHFASRVQSAVGYSLLKMILESEYGIYAPPDIAVDEHGKPFLLDCDLFFSISHCDAAVVCIVEETPVAIDVQTILTDKSPAFHERVGAPLDLDNRALTVLWTQKEASAKLDGRGLYIPLTDLPLPHHQLETTDYGEFVVSIAR